MRFLESGIGHTLSFASPITKAVTPEQFCYPFDAGLIHGRQAPAAELHAGGRKQKLLWMSLFHLVESFGSNGNTGIKKDNGLEDTRSCL